MCPPLNPSAPVLSTPALSTPAPATPAPATPAPATPEREARPDGTQAIRRAACLLRHIANAPRTGLNLRDAADATELSRSTAHRMLKCLAEERLVEQLEGTGRYVIGALAYELGLAAVDRQHEVLAWRPALEALSRRTGATVYLMGRSSSESVCLDKCEGSAVVRVFPVEVGQRRPLGVGAGATALLAAAPPGDADRVLDGIAPFLHRYTRLTPPEIRRNVEAARRSGFAESHGSVAEGVYGLGAAIRHGHTTATLALSLVVHESAATPERIAGWKRCMVDVIGGNTKA